MNRSIASRLKVGALIVGVAACASVGIVAGTAMASAPNPVPAPKGVTALDGPRSTPQPLPTYKTNGSGLSYGSAAKAVSPDTEPALIQVLATNGKTGYVYKKDLDAADGSNVTSPAEALAWQAAHEGQNTTLTAYAMDGTTVIGQFVVQGPLPGVVSHGPGQ
jgi:hypothetical protein